MNNQPKAKKDLPAFDRAIIFAEVDASSARFENYSKEQREAFAAEAKAVRVETNETCRVRR